MNTEQFDLGDIKASLQTANHGNWLLCDGQAVSRTDYADLFELVGTKFDASRSSSIYGNSTHVTPINQAVNYFIRAK